MAEQVPGAAPRKGARRRSESQWAMGYYEPQTPAERVKRDQDALDVFDRIVNLHAKEGFRSIMPQDLNVRYRWYGLYTQRPEEDGLFMMRIRMPGGVLSADQVEAIGRDQPDLRQGRADVTDRQNFQLHNIRIEDVPDVWARLSAVQLSTQEACGDVPRNILGCPLAGIAADELIDATPYVLAVNRRLTGTKEFSNLPRKFKISISGCRDQCARPRDHGHRHGRPRGRAAASASTSGRAAAWGPTRTSPSGSARSCPRSASWRSPSASSRCSATMATGARATTPG